MLPQAEYVKYVSVPWLLLGAASSIVKVGFLLKTIFFENELIKTKEFEVNEESLDFKRNISPEKVLSVVQ